MTKQDASRIAELLEQAYEAQDSIEDTVRHIAKEMPHITSADVIQVARVHAEEKRLDAAEYFAAADASLQIAEIIREAEGLNLVEAFRILESRARRGDERAAELLDKLSEAVLIVGLGSD
jgi:hypothetical protein